MILNCLNISEAMLSDIKNKVTNFKKLGVNPSLAIVRVKGDPASLTYVNSKINACKKVGIKSIVIELPENTEQDKIINLIADLNEDNNVHAILVQLPLPKHLDEGIIINSINPNKDVDCLSNSCVGDLFTGAERVAPCTPVGILEVLGYNVDLTSKDVLIINRSMLVGKPLVELIQRCNGTPTLAHSKTMYLSEKIINSDIIITAVGKPNFIKYKDLLEWDKYLGMLDRTMYIVDVSMNRTEDGKLCGDVEYNCREHIEKINSLKNIHITPVPGGIGLTTVASLLYNTIRLTALNN